MALISLTTDFGTNDYGVAEMKGVIWNIAPQVTLVDLCHSIPPQDIHFAARLLGETTPLFPAGSIHIFVVDPGVGTQRRPIAARIGGQFFVGPDNGCMSLVLQQARASGAGQIEAVALDRPEFWLPRLSRIFHGRDIFAPSAAHLAAGKALQQLGSPLQSLIEIEL